MNECWLFDSENMVRRFQDNCIQGPGREIWELYEIEELG